MKDLNATIDLRVGTKVNYDRYLFNIKDINPYFEELMLLFMNLENNIGDEGSIQIPKIIKNVIETKKTNIEIEKMMKEVDKLFLCLEEKEKDKINKQTPKDTDKGINDFFEWLINGDKIVVGHPSNIKINEQPRDSKGRFKKESTNGKSNIATTGSINTNDYINAVNIKTPIIESLL